MLKSTSFSIFVLAFVALFAGQGQAKPKPGLLDFLKGDECEEIDDNSCAIVYDVQKFSIQAVCSAYFLRNWAEHAQSHYRELPR